MEYATSHSEVPFFPAAPSPPVDDDTTAPAPKSCETASASAIAVAPDETAYELVQRLCCSRGTGLKCVDENLPDGCLGPSEVVIMYGETSSAKSILLRGMAATYVTPPCWGGYGLPAILVDADGTFDAALMARLVASRCPRHLACAEDTGRAAYLEESMSRLLVVRPQDPLDLLRHLRRLRSVLAANPSCSLLAVDSMSAWQPMAAAFPQTVTPILKACWNALARLQQERSIAVVTTFNASTGLNTGNRGDRAWCSVGSCAHLAISRLPWGEASAERNRNAGCWFAVTAKGNSSPFLVSSDGDVVNVTS